jgi:hypothetical protein
MRGKMDLSRIEDYFRGWIIGDFEPSLLKTSDFEVGILQHSKNEFWAPHVHKVVTEYNVLISGLLLLNDYLIHPGDIFVIKPGELSTPKFLEDCTILVIKTPSIPSDKYII